MNISSLARYAIGVSAAAAIFAGCSSGGSQTSGLAPGVPQQSMARSGHHHGMPSQKLREMTNAAKFAPQVHPKHGKSWIKPNAGRQWLAYSSDQSFGTVDIYNYRVQAGKMFGQITGLLEPYGDCLDSAGNVYVTDFALSEVFEFAHGGVTPIATASVPEGLPIGCSVDPTTGNLAVSVFEGFTSPGNGGVDVYSGGIGGSHTFYTAYNVSTGTGTFVYWPPGYDQNGNLFVEGLDFSTGYDIQELSGGVFTRLSGLSIGFAGAVQWDGFYMSATDQEANGTFNTSQTQFTVSGSSIDTVRTTDYTDTCFTSGDFVDWVQPALNGTTKKQNAIYAGNLDCASWNAFWNYANGGNPKRVLPQAIVPASAFGQVVSPPSD